MVYEFTALPVMVLHIVLHLMLELYIVLLLPVTVLDIVLHMMWEM